MPGRIELIQNRRANQDDWRGVEERLWEVYPENGLGKTVSATYYLQLFSTDSDASPPLQRTIQQRVDLPPQQFFAINPLVDSQTGEISALVTEGLDDLLQRAGFTPEMKLHLWPASKDIMLRIEHLGDPHDSDSTLQSVTIDMTELTSGLYELVNGKENNHAYSVHITEKSLTNNQNYADMKYKKLHWLSQNPQESFSEATEDGVHYQFQQQRIRLFQVKYTHSSKWKSAE